MNDLERYFQGNQGRLLHKWMHYFDIYERHFSRFRGKSPVILEIGVSHGGSLGMWKDYFGGGAKIYGADVNPACRVLEADGFGIFIGSQSDRAFLRRIRAQLPAIDILIDDGGHTMQQQIVTFEELYGAVAKDGVYLCEDVHSSYWLSYGGGYRRRGTFIEHAKTLVDKLNAWHSEQGALRVDSFTKETDSIHFYDSVVVIERGAHAKPHSERTGVESFAVATEDDSPGWKRWARRLSRAASMVWRALGG